MTIASKPLPIAATSGTTAQDITTEPTRTGITQSFRHFYASNGITLDAERLSTCHIALAGIRMLTEVLNKNQLDDQGGDGGIELNVHSFEGLLCAMTCCTKVLENTLDTYFLRANGGQ